MWLREKRSENNSTVVIRLKKKMWRPRKKTMKESGIELAVSQSAGFESRRDSQ